MRPPRIILEKMFSDTNKHIMHYSVTWHGFRGNARDIHTKTNFYLPNVRKNFHCISGILLFFQLRKDLFPRIFFDYAPDIIFHKTVNMPLKTILQYKYANLYILWKYTRHQITRVKIVLYTETDNIILTIVQKYYKAKQLK